MAFHVFLILLVFFLLLCLARLWHLYLPHHTPPHSRAGTMRPTVQRRLKPCTPLDCPACCLSSTRSSVVGTASLPVRPWCEVKSRRGAPKRMSTQGFACPNRNVFIPGSLIPTSTPWLEMANMVTLNRSRHFAARPVTPRSVLGSTLPCIV